MTTPAIVVDGLVKRYRGGSAEYEKVVLQDPATVIAIIGATFVAFMIAGTALFVRRERER